MQKTDIEQSIQEDQQEAAIEEMSKHIAFFKKKKYYVVYDKEGNLKSITKDPPTSYQRYYKLLFKFCPFDEKNSDKLEEILNENLEKACPSHPISVEYNIVANTLNLFLIIVYRNLTPKFKRQYVVDLVEENFETKNQDIRLFRRKDDSLKKIV